MVREPKKVQYYYDFHSTEEDLMGETSWHSDLITYLRHVLSWLFRGQSCAIHHNLNFYQTNDPMEYPIAPDLAVIKGILFRFIRSWALTDDPPPQVVFEILSEETWKKDVREKPDKYASMGVQEYFAYDPHEPPIRGGDAPRLMGWRLDPQRGEMVEIAANREGRLWSELLESWLVPDEAYLRLYDREHQMRLTEAEAQAQRADIEAERAEAADERAEAAIRQTEAAIRRAEVLAEKLRSLGINPDEI